MNKEVIEKLFSACLNNPGLPLTTMTSSDVLCDADHSYWMGSLSRVTVEYIYQDDEYSFIGDNDISERLSEVIEDEFGYEDDKLEQETEKRFKELIFSGEIKKHIILFIEV